MVNYERDIPTPTKRNTSTFGTSLKANTGSEINISLVNNVRADDEASAFVVSVKGTSTCNCNMPVEVTLVKSKKISKSQTKISNFSDVGYLQRSARVVKSI